VSPLRDFGLILAMVGKSECTGKYPVDSQKTLSDGQFKPSEVQKHAKRLVVELNQGLG
jgi:hypothetical protein